MINQIPAPNARGGRALPPVKSTPAARGGQAKPPKLFLGGGTGHAQAPVTTPQDTAMAAFRTALSQLRASTPAVDETAIRAPYVASEAITGQLGAGYQAAEQQAAQAAQAQYAQQRDQAQQHAAAFGISAGAGANPTALADNGTSALAQQGAAYTAAAPAATAQWQALLERTAGAKVSAAQLARQQGLTAGEQSLATALPGAIGNEEDRAFQRHTQGFNERLAETQLTDKQAADLRNYGLNVAKAGATASAATAKTKATSASAAASLAERARHDRATEATSQAGVALRARAQQATAKGLKGVPAALKALSGTAGSSGTTKAYRGWDVTVQALDQYTKEPTGATKVIQLPDKRKVPAGFKFVSAQPHLATVPSSSKAASITPSQWDAQMRGLLAQNPGQSAAIKAFLGPRPKAKQK